MPSAPLSPVCSVVRGGVKDAFSYSLQKEIYIYLLKKNSGSFLDGLKNIALNQHYPPTAYLIDF